MHDIWNPWHGCAKKSEGCANCYMYFLDRARNIDPSRVFRVKNNFDYPLQKNSRGEYKVKSGEDPAGVHDVGLLYRGGRPNGGARRGR